jgi:glycosyltransferase involved in cell wall biosynthesis
MIFTNLPNFYLCLIEICQRFNVRNNFSYSVHRPLIPFSPIGIKKDGLPLKVIVVSALRNFKGVRAMLPEIQKVINKYKNIKIYIIGDGEEKHKIEEYVKCNNLSEQIEILGSQDRITVLKIMKDSTFLLHNSYIEGVPQVLFEAFLCRTIPIIRAVGGIEFYVRDGYNGFLIDDDKNTISSIFDRILQHPEIIDKIKQNIAKSYDLTNDFIKTITHIDVSLKRLIIFRIPLSSKVRMKPML